MDSQTKITRDFLRQSDQLQRTVPFGRVEFVSLTTPAIVNTDFAVSHQLNPTRPNDVGYIAVQASSTGTLYHDITAGRREWTADTIYLRAAQASKHVVIMLFTPSLPFTSVMSGL
jgi:hypothetical protein